MKWIGEAIAITAVWTAPVVGAVLLKNPDVMWGVVASLIATGWILSSY